MPRVPKMPDTVMLEVCLSPDQSPRHDAVIGRYWIGIALRSAPSRTSSRKSFKSTPRPEEHTSELQSLMRISYAVLCLKKKTRMKTGQNHDQYNSILFTTI